MKQLKDCVSLEEIHKNLLFWINEQPDSVMQSLQRAYELGRQQEAAMCKLAQIDQEIEAE